MCSGWDSGCSFPQTEYEFLTLLQIYILPLNFPKM